MSKSAIYTTNTSAPAVAVGGISRSRSLKI